MNIIVKKTNNSLNKKNKPIIIIPKKYVKKATNRNRIRRQIRAILQKQHLKDVIIKYFCKEDLLSFQELKKYLENTLLKQ